MSGPAVVHRCRLRGLLLLAAAVLAGTAEAQSERGCTSLLRQLGLGGWGAGVQRATNTHLKWLSLC